MAALLAQMLMSATLVKHWLLAPFGIMLTRPQQVTASLVPMATIARQVPKLPALQVPTRQPRTLIACPALQASLVVLQ